MLCYESLWAPKSLGDEVHSREGTMESQGLQAAVLLPHCSYQHGCKNHGHRVHGLIKVFCSEALKNGIARQILGARRLEILLEASTFKSY